MTKVVKDLDGQWVRAEWSDTKCEWQSEDLPAELQCEGFQYCMGKTLKQLRRTGIRTYLSEADAQAGTSL
jgi:hypothetical protein